MLSVPGGHLDKNESYTVEHRSQSDQQSAALLICQLQTSETLTECVLNELWPRGGLQPVLQAEKRNKR